ncbi:endoplasmic reticulum resident protein 44-like [Portunus trituberculatus]|uniref:endoplasmic reticulum resident protein 44-like n=1 Tax=Portunus trituberculatus TaxID=210409 RepID=UPI001E1CBD48|nr:endoplasmic reticulum resident protein 44-like [Portunus trituberculatus]XP_045127400.1 endoplasmic reticulum resident protein 44-like [Portunus trituberculatus]XP_045127401.1 endoplasmic reticulum resident protein 44-like [Portunus trituberculatus]
MWQLWRRRVVPRTAVVPASSPHLPFTMPNSSQFQLILSFLTLLLQFTQSHGGALQLDKGNFDSIIGNNELVFINFYADWCRFSNILAPTWDETADKVRELFPDEGRVVVGKVDCDSESSIASRFHITKYPTLKLLRNGQATKREYRGQRSADAFASYIKEQLRDPIKILQNLDEINELEETKRTVIGYFEKQDSPEYELFRKIAVNLKDDCQFLAGFGDTVRSMHPPGESIVAFKASITKEDDAFTGSLSSYDELSIWATERCIPLVREITFQNAEELTEEGLPFLILFHDPEDTENVKKYTALVHSELADQKQNINFLTADGIQFAHPLHHLGKSKKDLPLIAIDSFRHMYLFPDYKDAYIEGKLKAFLQDLYSGKLHREFHYGPDPETTSEAAKQDENEIPSPTEAIKKREKPTTPPESTFKKLAPSKNRYTLLERDEL